MEYILNLDTAHIHFLFYAHSTRLCARVCTLIHSRAPVHPLRSVPPARRAHTPHNVCTIAPEPLSATSGQCRDGPTETHSARLASTTTCSRTWSGSSASAPSHAHPPPDNNTNNTRVLKFLEAMLVAHIVRRRMRYVSILVLAYYLGFAREHRSNSVTNFIFVF